MAGVLAGFATGAATSALALSALSLMTGENLPGPLPPSPPAETVRAAARPASPDPVASAPAARDGSVIAPAGQAPGAVAADGGQGLAEPTPAGAPSAALRVAPPARPSAAPAEAEARPVSADPEVSVRAVPDLHAPGAAQEAGEPVAPGTPPAAIPEATAAPLPEDAAIEMEETAFRDADLPDLAADVAALDVPETAGGVAQEMPSEIDAPEGLDAAALYGEVATAPRAGATPAAPGDDAAPVIGAAGPPPPVPAEAATPDLAAAAPEPSAPSEGGIAEALPPLEVAGADIAPDPAPGSPEEGTGTAVQFKRVVPPGAEPSGPGVVTNRLPQIGEAPAAEEEEPAAIEAPEGGEAEADPAPEAPAPEGDEAAAPALAAYAAPFEPAADRPALGLMLRDSAPRMSAEELSALDLPVTFVVDVSAADAEEAVRLYRNAGFEVALSANLPAGAQDTDAETAAEDWLRRLPETVAVVERSEGGLQESRPALRGLVTRLSESGHGLVTYPRGLNAARQVAGGEGVEAGTLFRDLTGADSAARLLDQAAFRATREDGVIVIGEADAATLAALSDWASTAGGRRVQMAPVSFVLRGTPEG